MHYSFLPCNVAQNSDLSDMRHFLSADGEAIILQEAMSQMVLDAFEVAKIDYVKGPPSATSAHQSADRQSVFRESKSCVKKQIEQRRNVDNSLLEENLVDAFNSLNTRFSITVPAAYRAKLIFGALHITHALANQALTPAKVVRGYTICGQLMKKGEKCAALQQFPDLAESTVDYEKIMDQSYTSFTDAEKLNMVKCIPAMVQQFRSGVKPTDSFMDNLNIPKLSPTEHKNRDNLVLWQQHAQVLTSAGTQAAFRDYLLANRLNRDPVALAEKRQAEKDMKRASTLEKANAKKLETVAKKTQDKAWLASITVEARQAEVLRRKDDAAAAKAQKQVQKVGEVAAMHARISARATLSSEATHSNIEATTVPVEEAKTV